MVDSSLETQVLNSVKKPHSQLIRKRYSDDERKSQADWQEERVLISLVVPAYNEALILEENLSILCQYMTSLEETYRWELIVINDGSQDATGDLAEAFARNRQNVRVVHHLVNCGLGQALKSAFNQCRGDYIVTLDLDLSYSPDHIQKLLDKIQITHSHIVVASPYMEGGKVSNVPWLRWFLSVWANRFLHLASKGSLETLTGMVRVYDARFLKTLNLRSMGMAINPEILRKAKILNARIDEIPAHLRWPQRKTKQAKRQSSMKIWRHTWSIFFYGFLFRPVMFFVLPSLCFFVISIYVNAWVLIHCWTNYQSLAQAGLGADPTAAVAAAFNQAPHAFFIGGMTLMLAVQSFSLGVLSVQSKSYFEEIFSLGTALSQASRDKT